MAWLCGEPNVEELLSDSIVHILMRHDGITVELFGRPCKLPSHNSRLLKNQDPKAARESTERLA